ncbi:MAG: hypothetical protein MJB14_02780 [Spirochaetes bacterium]|nr:hypothetical protein [Spirochaetota bacterium]
MLDDKSQILNLIKSFYELISGNAGQRDWQSFRNLFYTGAIIIQTGAVQGAYMDPKSVEEYIAAVSPYFESVSFYEREIKNQIHIFNHLGQAWSSYYVKKGNSSDSIKGVNSFQFCCKNKVWKILSVCWPNDEDADQLSAEYF